MKVNFVTLGGGENGLSRLFLLKNLWVIDFLVKVANIEMLRATIIARGKSCRVSVKITLATLQLFFFFTEKSLMEALIPSTI